MNTYRDPFYYRGPNTHAGVDFKDRFGAPVLAAADGEVISVFDLGNIGCGIGTVIGHGPFERYTRYCHLEKALVRSGQVVKRGEVIGLMGQTGTRITHLHFELCTIPCPVGDQRLRIPFTEDPLAISVGCFDVRRTYPTDRLVLTYPVECKD